MKKIYWICITILIIVIVGILMSISINSYESGRDNIIIENSYINYAWGFQYNGTVICDNGDIYRFDKNDREAYENVNSNLDDLRDYILDDSAKLIGKVTKSELKKIKEYMKNVNNTNYTETISGGNDMGSNIISVWNYDENEKIILKETGDWNKENTDENAKKIIDLVVKDFE